jgi:hypothetical protein
MRTVPVPEPDAQAPEPVRLRDTGTAVLLAEIAGLRAELAQVRGELAALDTGLIEAGTTASRALAKTEAIGRVLATGFDLAGAPVAAAAARRVAEAPDRRPARSSLHLVPAAAEGGAL